MKFPVKAPIAFVASLPLYGSGQALSWFIHLPGLRWLNALHKRLLAASKRVENWAGIHVMWDPESKEVVVEEKPKPDEASKP